MNEPHIKSYNFEGVPPNKIAIISWTSRILI